jgi:hypothetical protein
MSFQRAIAVLFLTLGFTFGSVLGAAMATQQAFAEPCPMNHHGGEGPCCKAGCTGAMAACSVKCSVPFGSAPLPDTAWIVQSTSIALAAWDADAYNPFITRPPPPIPIV